MKKILKRIGITFFAVALLMQTMGSYVFAAEDIDHTKEEMQEDINLEDRESIVSWILENIPYDLQELADMPEQWWEELLPNQKRVAENLLIPVYRSVEAAVEQAAFTPQEGDAVAHMNLASTGITDGYGSTLWRITNGGSNVFCLDHGASCKRSYNYGNFQKMSGETAYLIQNYGQSSTVSGYICIQMAIWALQSASTEAEAYAYAYTWYSKSYDKSEAASWAETTVQFFKLANGKSGSAWRAEGPSGSQRVAKAEEFVTTSYSEGNSGGGEEPGTEMTEPEFTLVEDSMEVSYDVVVKKADWQTGVGLQGCVFDIFENGAKVGSITTNSNGEASYKAKKSETFTAEYCSNYEELTPQQQAEISGFSSLSEAEKFIEESMEKFANKKYTYSCKEVTAPKGYVWKKNEGSESLGGNCSAGFSFTNERTLGAVELIKYDTESENCIIQGEGSLEGAVYGIYAAEDIVHQDKKTGVLFETGELVKTAVIGKSPKRNTDGYVLNTDGSRNIENPSGTIAYENTPGRTVFGDLELGKYYIKEITPSKGYMLDETGYNVTFTYKDQMVKVEVRDEEAKDDDNTLHMDDENASKTVYSGDYVIKQGIQFVKTSDNTYQTELKPIEGAGFCVYLIRDLTGVKNGEINPINETWSSDDIMTFYDYDFSMEESAVLYKRNDETWTQGDKNWLENIEGDFYRVKEMFTDSNGYIETPELPYGTYVIAENTTPENHVSAKPFIAAITKDGGVLYTDETKQVVEKIYTEKEAVRYGDRKVSKAREGRMLQNQRIINNTITKAFIRIVKADEEFLAKPGTCVRAEEVVRGTVFKEGAEYRLRCLSLDVSEESLKALNWKYDILGYLTYYDPNAKLLMGTVLEPYTTSFLKRDGKITDSFITLPQELPVGTYELEELAAPEGYVLNGSEQAVIDRSEGRKNGYEIINSPKEKCIFTVGNGAVYPDGQMGTNKYVMQDGYGNLTVTVLPKNQVQKGIVEIYKHGEQLAGITDEKHFIYQDAPIEGAEFQIVAEEDIYSQELDRRLLEKYEVNCEEFLLYKKGDVVETLVTDKNGFAYAAGLYIGKYKIVEICAGKGFVLNSRSEAFEITPQDQKVSFDFHFSDYRNERQKLEIYVLKKDVDTKEPLSGALYGIYPAEDIFTNIDYVIEDDRWIIRDLPEKLVKKDTLIAIAATGADGITVFEEDLPLGKYYVRELKAPDGYILAEEDVTIDGSYEGAKGGQNVEKQTYQIIFENQAETDDEKEPHTPPEKPKSEKKERPEKMPEEPVTEHVSQAVADTGDKSGILWWSCFGILGILGLVFVGKRKKKS